MSNFTLLLEKLLPIYLIIFLGFIAGHYLKVEKDSVAKLAIYFAAPIVVFNAFANMESNNQYLWLPVAAFVIATTIACASLVVYNYIFKGRNKERNLLAAMAGSGNTGYFGLPLVIAVLGTHAGDISIIYVLGLIIYESTVSYFLISKGNYTTKQALKNVVMLPSVYACIVGIIFNKSGLELSESWATTITYFRGAYVVLGMMIVGIGLGSITRSHLDIKFTTSAFLNKFIVAPLAMGLFIYLDNRFIKLFDTEVHQVLLILSATPLAANSVAFATRLKVHPEKTALAVFASTIFALIYLPIFITIFI